MVKIVARGWLAASDRSVWQLRVERVVSHPDSILPEMTSHSVYVAGQALWQAPLIRPIMGDLPDELCVLELARVNGSGSVRVLFDPARVIVSGGVQSTHRTRQEGRVETPDSSTDRSDGCVRIRSMGRVGEDDYGTAQRLVYVDTGGPRNSRGHALCSHEPTKSARAACRKARRVS